VVQLPPLTLYWKLPRAICWPALLSRKRETEVIADAPLAVCTLALAKLQVVLVDPGRT
jgi:hypothetical protein